MNTDPFLIFTKAALIIAILLGFYRLMRGPSALDRILAFDAIVICAVALTVVLSRMWNTALYIELILIVASLGFFTTVAFLYYYEHTGEPLQDMEKKS